MENYIIYMYKLHCIIINQQTIIHYIKIEHEFGEPNCDRQKYYFKNETFSK